MDNENTNNGSLKSANLADTKDDTSKRPKGIRRKPGDRPNGVRKPKDTPRKSNPRKS